MRAVRRCAVVTVFAGASAAMLAACSPGITSLDLVSRVQPEWSVPAALVGSPVAAEGVVVSYVDAGVDALQVVAWDARSGAELWRDSASYGSIPGYATDSAQILEVGGENVVAYLQDDPLDDGDWQRVAVTELDTGHHLDNGDLVIDAVTAPGECDDEAGVCIRGRSGDEWESREQLLRVDLVAGRLVAERGPTLPLDARFLGGHVYSTLDRAPEGVEMLGYATDGVVLWERPYTEVFDPGYSSDGGWSWLDDDSRAVLIGTGGPWDPASRDIPITTYDLDDGMLVGLDPDSGETLWEAAGADRWCHTADIDPTKVTDVIPACVYESGTMTIDRTDPDDPTLSIRHLRARIIGLDASTGEELWSVAAGGDPSVAYDWAGGFVSRLGPRPVRIDDSVAIVDVLTGATSGVPDDAVFACQIERGPFRAHRPWSTEPEPDRYSGGFGVFPCNHERQRTDRGFSPGALEMAAVDAGGGWLVVGGSAEISGFRPVAP